MTENNDKEFSVQAVVEEKMQEVLVQTSETTDGVTFYICKTGDKEITQIRKDEQSWKQIWGSISDEDVKSIGEAIEGFLFER